MNVVVKATITKSRNRLRQKATPMEEGEFAKLLQLAQATADELGKAYESAVSDRARALTSRVGKAQAADGDDRLKALEAVSDIAFELRGEGASFGFDVVSLVADSLYRIVSEPQGEVPDFTLKVVEMHALALNALLAGGVRSAADDAVAAQILAALAAAKRKVETG